MGVGVEAAGGRQKKSAHTPFLPPLTCLILLFLDTPAPLVSSLSALNVPRLNSSTPLATKHSLPHCKLQRAHCGDWQPPQEAMGGRTSRAACRAGAARNPAQPQRGEARRGEVARRVIERLHAATPSAHLFKARPPRGNAAANSTHSALIKDLLLPSFFFCAFCTRFISEDEATNSCSHLTSRT